VREVRIEKGESLFAYTDGLADTANPAGQLFNVQELFPMLAENQPLTMLLEKTQKRIKDHAAGGSQADDITLLAARRS
jgi:serine phosphatase RsbU (regulator of sigma subunit)